MKPYSFEELPRETLVALLKVYLHGLEAVDGWWFTGVEETLGTERAVEIDRMVWERVGKGAGQRLKQALGLGEDAASLAALFRYASYPRLSCRFLVDQLSSTTVSFRVSGCASQEARQRLGKELFPCREVCQAQLQSLAQAISAGAGVTCVTCPPQRPSPELWCEWHIHLDQGQE